MAIQIVINEDVAEQLALKCISAADAEAAVATAELDKLFFERVGGERLCALRLENVTYWIEYTACGTTLEVKNAYFHRMKFEELLEG